jgi:hypothetical protein
MDKRSNKTVEFQKHFISPYYPQFIPYSYTAKMVNIIKCSEI